MLPKSLKTLLYVFCLIFLGMLYAGCDDDGPVNVPAEPPAPEPPTYSEDFGKQIVFTVKGVKFTMMLVEGGTFAMGATSEQIVNDTPRRRVPCTQRDA